MNGILEQEEIKIEDIIYEIGGKQVILSFDLAKLYHCKANINRIWYKTFSIALISDEEICKLLIDRINNLR